MTGFYAHHFSVSTALCDGGAYLLPVAALLPPPQRRAATHLVHLYSCSWPSWPVTAYAWLGFELRALAWTYTREPSQHLSILKLLFNLQPVGWNLKGDISTSWFGVRVNVGGRGWAHSIPCLWVPISSPLPIDTLVYLIPFLSYSATSKSVSAYQSDPDTMTYTAPEATTSPSGKNYLSSGFSSAVDIPFLFAISSSTYFNLDLDIWSRKWLISKLTYVQRKWEEICYS